MARPRHLNLGGERRRRKARHGDGRWVPRATLGARRTPRSTDLSTPVALRKTFGLDDRQSGISAGDIPAFMRVRQNFDRPRESDVAAATRREVAPFLEAVLPGQRIAVTGSSRGIPNLAVAVREVAAAVREAGGEPFVVPGMGSHGGATAAGQIEVLANNGITEESVHAPIRSSMEVIRVGTTSTGFPVFLDRNASEADGWWSSIGSSPTPASPERWRAGSAR